MYSQTHRNVGISTLCCGLLVALLSLSFLQAEGQKNLKPEDNLLKDAKVLGIEKTEDRRFLEIKVSFEYSPDQSDSYLELHLSKADGRERTGIPYVIVNGQRVEKPAPDMTYIRLPALPVDLLKQGTNEISIPTSVRNAEVRSESISDSYFLKTLSASDLAFQTGPTMGAAGTDHVSISCRFNLPAEATLLIAGREIKSGKSRMHKFNVTGLKPGTEYSYKITGKAGNTEISTPDYDIKSLPGSGKLMFVMLGDSRSNRKAWGDVARAVLTHKPAFVVHTGDMCASGAMDHQWDEHFWGAAKELCATIPMYMVIGNHDGELSIIEDMFPLPEDRKDFAWSQVIGDCHFIGLGYHLKTSTSTPEQRREWLGNKLKHSQSKFIFFSCHYPPYTSGMHQPDEFALSLIPILEQYKVTANFCGHNHNYERSESPGGVSVIVTGGAGAGTYGPKENNKPNSYSKVFAREHHFCVLTVDGDTAMMKVYKKTDGEVIDSRIWQARKTAKGSQVEQEEGQDGGEGK